MKKIQPVKSLLADTTDHTMTNAKKRKTTEATEPLTGNGCKRQRSTLRFTLEHRGADSLGLRVGKDERTISKPPTGIAKEAGLAMGDVIVSVNDVKVTKNGRSATDLLRDLTRAPSRPDTIIEVRRRLPVERVPLRRLDAERLDAAAAPEGERARPQKRAAEAEEDKEGSAAGSSSPAPKGEDLPHPLRKKPRGRTPRGMRWDGTNEAGRWVNDNKGSKDDPIDLCD